MLENNNKKRIKDGYTYTTDADGEEGLENEVIIITDLDDPINIEKTADKVQHYVAMSRARGFLCVIWNKVNC